MINDSMFTIVTNIEVSGQIQQVYFRPAFSHGHLPEAGPEIHTVLDTRMRDEGRITSRRQVLEQ